MNDAQIPVRRLILDSAARLLRHRGYEAATLRAIALQAGIKAGSVYHYFSSKELLVAAVVDEGVREVHRAVIEALARLPDGSGPKARIETALAAHLQASLESSDYPAASLRAFAFMPESVRASCAEARRDYEEIWRGLVASAARAKLICPDISQDMLRLMLLGAVNWASEWYRPGRLSIAQIARDFARAVLDHRPGTHPVERETLHEPTAPLHASARRPVL